MSKKPQSPHEEEAQRLATSAGKFRTPLADELHKLIMDYCIKASDGDSAEADSTEIEKFLASPDVARNPGILLENSINGCPHFLDVVHIPFEKDIKCDEDGLRGAKSLVLFNLLTDTCRDIIKHRDMKVTDYAKTLFKANDDHYTLLHQAVKSGDKEVYTTVRDELRRLHELKDAQGHKIIDDETYAKQFTLKTTEGGFRPFDTAMRCGNDRLIKAFLADLKEVLPPETYDALAKNHKSKHTPRWLQDLLTPSSTDFSHNHR